MTFYSSETYIEDLETAIGNSVGIEELRGGSVLVTGAAGLIGSFLVDMLLRYNEMSDSDIKIYAAGRSLSRLRNRFNKQENSRLIYVKYDMLLPIEFDFDIDYIIHAAGNAHPEAFNKDPVGTIVGNVNGTYHLLEYGKTHGTKRFLYVSTGEVYGQGDPELAEFAEEYSGYLDITAARSSYPSSKRAAETLCASYSRQYGLEVLIARPCHVYGPCTTADDNRASAQFINNVLRGEDVLLKSSGVQVRSYSYIADCVSALITVLLNGKSGETYNIANPSAGISIAGLARIIAETAGRKVLYVKPTAAEIADRTFIEKQILSSKKLESLGWTGAFDVQSGVEHTIKILKGL